MANTTWNPSDKTASLTLSGSNLVATASANGSQSVRAVDRQVSGKYYWEVTNSVLATGSMFGVANGVVSLGGITTGAATSVGCALATNSGNINVDGSTATPTLGALTVGTVVCIALDLNARLIWFRYGTAANWNGNASNNPATGIGGVSVPFGATLAAYPLSAFSNGSTGVHTANFGDTAFSGTVPSGFTPGFPTGTPALNAANTQTALEQWAMPNAQAQATQISAEMWATVTSGSSVALLTQVALEEWVMVTTALSPRQCAVTVSVS